MGNCLVQQEKLIKVKKTDGRVLQYKAPIKVNEFSGHLLPDSLQEIRKLNVEKKKVKFSDQKGAEDGQGTAGIVRIKLAISKQELQELLLKGGVSVQDMISRSTNQVQYGDVWKPELESIPEVD